MEKSTDIAAHGDNNTVEIDAGMPSDSSEVIEDSRNTFKKSPLTCKNAVEFLLNGNLNKKVCKFCLNVTSQLMEVDHIMKITGKRAIYGVSIRDMIGHFYPFRLTEDPDLPNQICNRCVDRTITSYLFTQQCEQSERALQNCFNEIHEKIEKLDPLEPTKKRGRKKLKPNHDVINLSHLNVHDYAEPIINLINQGSTLLSPIKHKHNILECPKCWQVLPNLELLLNHKQKHPDTMWFHCHSCGSSFAKQKSWKIHVTNCTGKVILRKPTSFHCNNCGATSENYVQHLQHTEKHKFKRVLDELIVKRSQSLCMVCLVKQKSMVELDNLVTMHGATPELSGNRTVFDILESTVPNIFLDSYSGSKVCDKCLDQAISSYVFVNQSMYTRRRLHTCISSMLDHLKLIENPEKSLFVEVSNNLICPIDDVIVSDEADDIFDEAKLKVDVLEDEFRIKSSDTETELSDTEKTRNQKTAKIEDNIPNEIDNPARRITKTYLKKRIRNGINSKYVSEEKCPINDICSEFLTFKKKPLPAKNKHHKRNLTCPVCNKHFITDHFLMLHILKHIIKTVKCKHCDQTFKSKFNLQEHSIMTHVQNVTNVLSCDICGRLFIKNIDLARHQASHYNKPCYCGKVFKTQRNFDSHLQRHVIKFRISNMRSYKACSFCEKQYLWRNQLSRHVNKVHLQMKPYYCNMCEKQCYTKSDLFHHKKIHKVPSVEKCQFCEKSLKCRRDLVRHVRKHIDCNPDKV